MEKLKVLFVIAEDIDGFKTYEEIRIPSNTDVPSYCHKKYFKPLEVFEVVRKWGLSQSLKEEVF